MSKVNIVLGCAILPPLQMCRLYKGIIISNWLFWKSTKFHNHVTGLDINLTHQVSFPLSNPVTSGLKGVLNVQNTVNTEGILHSTRASRNKGSLCHMINFTLSCLTFCVLHNLSCTDDVEAIYSDYCDTVALWSSKVDQWIWLLRTSGGTSLRKELAGMCKMCKKKASDLVEDGFPKRFIPGFF